MEVQVRPHVNRANVLTSMALPREKEKRSSSSSFPYLFQNPELVGPEMQCDVDNETQGWK